MSSVPSVPSLSLGLSPSPHAHSSLKRTASAAGLDRINRAASTVWLQLWEPSSELRFSPSPPTPLTPVSATPPPLWMLHFQNGDMLVLNDQNMQRLETNFVLIKNFRQNNSQEIRLPLENSIAFGRLLEIFTNPQSLNNLNFNDIDELFALSLLADTLEFSDLANIMRARITDLLEYQIHHDRSEALQKAIEMHQYAIERKFSAFQAGLEKCISHLLRIEAKMKSKQILIDRMELLRGVPIKYLGLPSSQLNDAQLHKVCKTLPSLNELDLGMCSSITTHGLKGLRWLPSLQKLIFSNWKGYSKQTGGPSVEPLAFLRKTTTLQSLTLSNCANLQDKDLAEVGNLPQLKELDIGDNNFSDAGLLQLQKLQTLQSLDISSCMHIKGPGLEALIAALPTLKYIKCHYIKLPKSLSQTIAKLTAADGAFERDSSDEQVLIRKRA